MNKEKLMREAIRLSRENVINGGGPFAALITNKEGEIISIGVNKVTASNDPTAHAEVNAIRNACSKLKKFDLQGLEIFSSCEPCPMCLGAIYWSHLDKLYYANSKDDARKIGFDDSFIYNEIELEPSKRKLGTEVLLRNEAIKVFQEWDIKNDKIEY